MVVVCYMDNMVYSLISNVLVIPSLIGLALTTLNCVDHQFIFAVYGWFLEGMYFTLLAMNAHLQKNVSDPICPEHILPGAPSIVAFYVASLTTFIVSYALWRWRRPSVFRLVLLLLIFAGPPAVLVWFGYNSALDVALTMIYGIVSTALFFAMLSLVVRDSLDSALIRTPFSWLGYKNTWLVDEVNDKDPQRLWRNHIPRDFVREWRDAYMQTRG